MLDSCSAYGKRLGTSRLTSLGTESVSDGPTPICPGQLRSGDDVSSPIGAMNAFRALADATGEYEQGSAMAFLRRAMVPVRVRTAPVRLLDGAAAVEVARLRKTCGRALANAADACTLRFETSAIFDTKWPIRRSEVPARHRDQYQGELRPMGWKGFEPQPMLHVYAK